MIKRRRLEPNQEIIVIYDQNIGFVQEPATFVRYESIIHGEVQHETPLFKYRDGTISGLECFWILPSDALSQEKVEKIQYELISVQLTALEISKTLGYSIPVKIKDKEIEQMAEENVDRLQAVIEKFGFDPRDESWLEKELANNERERNWFTFERDNALLFADEWDDILPKFNLQYQDTLSLEEAKNLSRKRMRYALGAFYTRMSGNPNKDDWKKASREFEAVHRQRENRMLTWSMDHVGKFPLVRVKEPVTFFAGPYFHECLENIPHVFTDINCRQIKPGVVLRAVSYDSKLKYIRLDFTPDVRKLLKPDEDPDDKPWVCDKEDYLIWVRPIEIETSLDILEKLE